MTHRTQWVFTLEADLLLVARGSPCPLVHSLVHSAIVAAQHRVQHLVRVVKRIHQGHCLWPGTVDKQEMMSWAELSMYVQC